MEAFRRKTTHASMCLNDIIDFDFNLRHNTAFHNYNTRQCNKLHLPGPKTNWGKQKLTYEATKDFNNLNQRFRELNRVSCLKRKSVLKTTSVRMHSV
ncbi:hypothetical protein P5673_029127 [Acropora cervicornis]|uniref:Uncharacterized protein n=1 Tax=Acropora cervicornis TaxID=6130 RepID=A0AAD9UUM6_ACRCE|nr:hypothetical protein P5673_029127 [Acropora cervicornis]